MKLYQQIPFYNGRRGTKVFLALKLTWFLSLFLTIGASASVWSGSTKISVNLTNQSLQDLFAQIENNTQYRFFYNNSDIDVSQRVTVNMEDKTVGEILSAAFSELPYSFKELSNNVILIQNNAGKTDSKKDAPQGAVSGKVVDDSGLPLPGVSVLIKGTTNGTVTNPDGVFTLTNVPESATLVFSFVGMETQEVAVGSQTEINVSLKEESIGLGEVVAIGYGTQKKADLTGAVASVTPDKLQGVNETLSHALQGQLSGVTVIQNSGEPGGDVQIRVRGAGSINDNTPLYIIDGMIGDITDLNPADIESISVLKDAASAAIYGSRGANGVVIVTTKQGSSDEKTHISYSTTQGIQLVWKKPSSLTAEQRNTIHTEALANDGYDESESIWDYYLDEDNAVTRTNWFDEIFRAGYETTHNFSIQGGNKKSNYMFSLGYLDNNGIIKVSDFKRYNIRFNSQHELVKNLTFGENFSAFVSDKQAVNQGTYDGVLVAALFNMRNTPVWEDKENKVYGAPRGDYPNPVASLNSIDDNTKGYGIQGNGYLQYKFLKMFTLKTDFGYMLDLSKQKYFVAAAENGGRGLDVSSLEETYGVGQTWIWNNTLNFDKNFGVHHLSALAGMSMEYGITETTDAGIYEGFSVTDDDLRYYDNGSTLTTNPSGTAVDYSMMGYFGRVSYDFAGKYLFAANIRADGSSKFSEDNRWGVFPSFSAGWRLSDEPFFEPLQSAVNNFKIRASWGQLGNDKISNYYQYYSTIASVDSPTLGGEEYAAYAQDGMANTDIKWEVTTQTDLGIDLAFLKNKLNMSLDYYDKETSDILVQVPLVYSLGVGTAPYQNAGKVSNKGFDIDLSYRNWDHDFKYGISANVSHVTNKLKTLGISGKTEMFAGDYKNHYVGRIAEGEAIGHFYVLNDLGLFQSQEEIDNYVDSKGNLIQPDAQPGDIKFEDRNGDGTISSDDRFNAGNSFPKFNYSMNFNAEYKGFDFAMQWTGSEGNKIFNGLTLGEKLMVGTDYNNGSQILDRWTPEHTNTNIPRVSILDENDNSSYSTLFIEDGSYLRLKYLTFGYTFDKAMFAGAISKLRIYVTCQNLLTFTKYDGFDPEVGSSGSFNDNLYGIDKGIYPQAKSFVFGVNLDL